MSGESNSAMSTALAPPAVRSPPAGPTQAMQGNLRSVVVRGLVLALALLAGSVFMIDWDDLLGLSGVQRTDDAYLRGDPTTLSARVAGYVTRVAVGDLADVKAGDILYEIDDAEYRARVDLASSQVGEAAAQVAIADAQLGLQARQIELAQAGADLTRSDLIHAEEELTRQNALLGTPAYLQRNWEQATANALALRATDAGEQATIAGQRAQVAVLQATLRQAQATLQARQAALVAAQITLSYTHVRSPRDGRLGLRIVRLGQYVTPGTPMIQLVPRNDVWVVGNFRESQMRAIRVGEPATLTLDADPGIRLSGHVDSIEPSSEALGSLLPPDRSTGNFTKIAQRVPVKIRIDPGQVREKNLIGRLLPGLSVEVAVDTRAGPDTVPAAGGSRS
jgi:membrane fusion protein (multidrug efflux system)